MLVIIRALKSGIEQGTKMAKIEAEKKLLNQRIESEKKLLNQKIEAEEKLLNQKIEIAKKLLNQNIDIKIISETTGLSIKAPYETKLTTNFNFISGISTKIS